MCGGGDGGEWGGEVQGGRGVKHSAVTRHQQLYVCVWGGGAGGRFGKGMQVGGKSGWVEILLKSSTGKNGQSILKESTAGKGLREVTGARQLLGCVYKAA